MNKAIETYISNIGIFILNFNSIGTYTIYTFRYYLVPLSKIECCGEIIVVWFEMRGTINIYQIQIYERKLELPFRLGAKKLILNYIDIVVGLGGG